MSDLAVGGSPRRTSGAMYRGVPTSVDAAVAVSWTASLYAAVAGLLLAPAGDLSSDFFGLPVALAGLGALVAGLLSLLGVGEGRALVLPPAIVGAVFLVTGLVLDGVDLDAGPVLVGLLVLLVLCGSVFPWLALGLTGRGVEQVYSISDITADPQDIDAAAVGSDARLAHEILVAIASNDDQRAPNDKNTLKETFSAAKIPAEIEVYSGAHGWCPPDSTVYNEADAEKAWSRLLALYGKALA